MPGWESLVPLPFSSKRRFSLTLRLDHHEAIILLPPVSTRTGHPGVGILSGPPLKHRLCHREQTSPPGRDGALRGTKFREVTFGPNLLLQKECIEGGVINLMACQKDRVPESCRGMGGLL